MQALSCMGAAACCHRLAGLLAGLLLLAWVGEGWAVEVTLRAPTAVLTTLPTKVTVTLTPSPSPGPVVLSLPVHPWCGPGEAVFLPGRQTQITLTQSTTVEVLGTVISEQEANVLLVAMAGDTLLASHLFTVVDPKMLTREQAIDRAREALQPELAARPGLRLNDFSMRLRGSEYHVGFVTPPLREPGIPRTERWVTVDAFSGTVKRIGEREQ